MRLRIPIALVAAVVLSLSHAASVSGQATKLSKDDKKVLDYLVKYWGEDYDVTSVDLAMESLKMEPSDSTRFRIGAYIKQHPELHEVIRRWGWVTIVLNANEKLIARTLINAQRDGRPAPSIAEIASAVAVTEDQARRGLVMLERYGIVQRNKRVATHYLKWEPRIDFIYHTVTLADGRKFSVN